MTLGLLNFHVDGSLCCCLSLESLGLKGFLRGDTFLAKSKLSMVAERILGSPGLVDEASEGREAMDRWCRIQTSTWVKNILLLDPCKSFGTALCLRC